MHVSSIVLGAEWGQEQIVQFQFLVPQHAVWVQVTGQHAGWGEYSSGDP